MVIRKPLKKSKSRSVIGKTIAITGALALSLLFAKAGAKGAELKQFDFKNKAVPELNERNSRKLEAFRERGDSAYEISINKVPIKSFFAKSFLDSVKIQKTKFDGFSLNSSISAPSPFYKLYFLHFNIGEYGKGNLSVILDYESLKVVKVLDSRSQNYLFAGILFLIEKEVFSEEAITEIGLSSKQMRSARDSVLKEIGDKVESAAKMQFEKMNTNSIPNRDVRKTYERILLRELKKQGFSSEYWIKWAKDTAGKISHKPFNKTEERDFQKAFQNKQGAQFSSYQKARRA